MPADIMKKLRVVIFVNAGGLGKCTRIERQSELNISIFDAWQASRRGRADLTYMNRDGIKTTE